mgnify:CR=1 FL=1
MKRAPLITGLLLISTSCAYASSGGCGADSTSGATNYSSVVDDVTVNQTDNVTGREFTSATLSSTNWQYACSCSAGKAVKLVYMVSPVLTTTGHQTGYYKLNDSLDIKTTLQANDIPGLTTDQVVSVNTRFTQIKNNTVYSAATQTGVCQGDTSRYGPVNIGANTTFTLYVTKPFLGSMTIPKTDIAVIKGAWVDGMGSPSTGDFHDLVKLSIQGNLTAPQSCKINQGDVIKVNFGFINGQKFTTRNAMPDGFTPVDFDITYDCGDTSKIKNSLQMRIDYRNMNHLFAGIQQDSMITQTQGSELWNIHCRSLVGVIKAEDIFAGLMQCAVTLNIAVARPAGDAVCVIPTRCHDDA